MISPNEIVYASITVATPSKYKNRPPDQHQATCVTSVGDNWDGWLRLPEHSRELKHLGLDKDAKVVKVEVLVKLGYRNGFGQGRMRG